MKLQADQSYNFKDSFAKMQSKEDFLTLLNQVKPLVFGEKTVPFELKQLTWHGNPKLGGARYHEFKIKKKSGGERNIHTPIKGLKALQMAISLLLQIVFDPHKAANGFVMGKSIVDNAKVHIGQRYVFNLDLKDFFPSINQARVWKCLQLRPFNLNRENSKENLFSLHNPVLLELENDEYLTVEGGFVKKIIKVNKHFEDNRLGIANLIAAISCTEMEVERKNELGEWIKVRSAVLPQGAPTSPVITNIVCQRLDYILTGLAKRFGLKYSRYADDLTFSSNHNVYQSSSDFQIELDRIISDQGFYIKESKTRLQGDGYRQEVTSLLVNEKVNVTQRYIKQLRMWLYYWENYGYDRASKYFIKSYIKEKGIIKQSVPSMTKVLEGKLNYLKMVKGSEDGTFQKLKERFDKLNGPFDPVNTILDVWEKEGIEIAMDLFYQDISK
jgi:retron-type reverse transcriptase